MTTSRSDARRPRASRSRTLALWAGGIFALLLILIGARILALRSFDTGPLPSALSEIAGLPITRADGQVTQLGDLVKPGLPTVISLWASWCGPCRSEAPTLVDLRHRYGPDRLNFLYLNAREAGASRPNLNEFVQGNGFAAGSYAVLDDANLSKLTNDNRNLIPRTYVFDRAGKPIAMIVGYNRFALARVEGLLR